MIKTIIKYGTVAVGGAVVGFAVGTSVGRKMTTQRFMTTSDKAEELKSVEEIVDEQDKIFKFDHEEAEVELKNINLWLNCNWGEESWFQFAGNKEGMDVRAHHTNFESTLIGYKQRLEKHINQTDEDEKIKIQASDNLRLIRTDCLIYGPNYETIDEEEYQEIVNS